MVERISAEKAHELVTDDDWVYLDVRSVQEFENGHPEGAYNIPLMHVTPEGLKPNPTFLDEVEAVFPKDRGIVVGCRSGGRSLRAAEAMEAAGYTRVVDQRAGFTGATDAFGHVSEPGWQAKGLPVSRQALPGRSYEELRAKAAARR